MSANKVLFDYLDLEIPLLVTFVHFSITSFVMVIIRAEYPDLIGHAVLSRSEFTHWILPIAVCTAGDVVLSNMAYSRLPISVMTVLKSSAPVCIYTAAVVGRLERFQWRLSGLCVLIAMSVACAMPESEESDTVEFEFTSGIVIVLAAMVCLSVRWVLVQTLTRRYTPGQLLLFIQPTSALVLLPFAFFFECNSSLGGFWNNGSSTAMMCVGLICGSAFAAMALLLFEYRIVHYTTSLTLSIAGIGKETLTLLLSVLIFGEWFTIRQIVCILLSMVGIVLYALLRRKTAEEEAVPKSAKASFVLVPSSDDVPADELGMNQLVD